jgi:hypothetical protein
LRGLSAYFAGALRIVLVQCAGKSDGLFDLSYGLGAVHLSSSENHSCMKFIAEDLNGSNFVACFKMVKYQAVLKNGIHARLLVKLTHYTVIVFWRNLLLIVAHVSWPVFAKGDFHVLTILKTSQ